VAPPGGGTPESQAAQAAQVAEVPGRDLGPEARARAFLALLGRADHPHAQEDPLHALYQVAVDYRCTAQGYRDLYLYQRRLHPGPRGP
jgi:hypothetical protein